MLCLETASISQIIHSLCFLVVGIPCQTYTDWRHTETQTQNLTSTIGTITPYWPQENGYANESATQTWYSSLEPMTQMTDNFSMTDNYPMIYDNASE